MKIQNKLNTSMRTFRVVITKQEDGGYMANIPSLTHCFSFGETIDEAMENLHEALEGVIETMEENGWAIPDDSQNMEVLITMPISSKSLAYA
jgi:antitoxin HicB